jgi:Domain of unknown function (DUF4249)
MRYKVYIFHIFMIGLMCSCITPIDDLKLVDAQSFFTVEATLNDQAEPQKVKLYLSSNELLPNNFDAVTKAKVYFIDEKGVKEDLLDGTYLTSTKFVGRVGGTYTLHIETADGKKYQSQAETMRPVPEIENLISRFEINDNYAKGELNRVGFNLFLDFQDPSTPGDNYQWYWKHYEKALICETCEGGIYDFTLNSCVKSRFPPIKTYNYRCDGDCWDITFSTDLNIFSDNYLNGKRITGKQVARVPFDDFSPYYLQFEQRAITRNAYNYYQSLNAQIQSNGTLFDVPAETKFSFNIKSTTNPSDKILGIFDVYSVRKKIFYIDRTQVSKGELPVVKRLQGEIFICTFPGCIAVVECADGLFRTPFKPVGWKE